MCGDGERRKKISHRGSCSKNGRYRGYTMRISASQINYMPVWVSMLDAKGWIYGKTVLHACLSLPAKF